MMKIYSKVKMLTILTGTQEYTHKYYSVKTWFIAIFALYRDSYNQETTWNSLHDALSSYTDTHINNHV